MRQIILHIEGGGSEERTKRPLREGFHQFFHKIFEGARQKRLSFRTITCGSGQEAYKSFTRAIEDQPEAFNVLLVDADRHVSTSRSQHVTVHFHWVCQGFGEEQCHLMVQVMEAWFLADPKALEGYYAKDFQTSALPDSSDVETIEKDRVLAALKQATRKTKKGEYHKIKHASDLLKLVRPSEVRKASIHCESLFQTLESKIQAVN